MPNKLLRVGAGVSIAVGLYALVGFWIAPVVALRIANDQLARLATVPAHLDQIRFNPFTLQLDVFGLHIGQAGAEQLGFEHLAANLQVDSLWRRQVHLASLGLTKPTVQVLISPQGALNLSGLFKPSTAPAQPANPDDRPFPITVDQLTLNDGFVHFRDGRGKAPVEFTYDALDFQLRHLTTLPKGDADMQLSARGPLVGKVDWAGSVSLFPFTSQGYLTLKDAPLHTWWPYVQAAAPLKLERGQVSAALDYSMDLSKGAQVKVTNARISLSPFAIAALDGRPLVRLEGLDVSDTALDLAKRQVKVGKVAVRQLETWAAREADGQLDWQKLFATPVTEQPPAPSGSPSQTAQPWDVKLADVRLSDAKVHLADNAGPEPVTLELAPLNIHLAGYDTLNASPFQLDLDSGVGRQGRLQAKGEVNLDPVTATLAVTTRDIDLRIAQTYITPFIRLELRSGMLDSDLNVALANTDPLAFTVEGKAQVNQLHTLDTLKSRDFVRWATLGLDGLSYRHNEGLSIDKVTIAQPYARFMINEDRSTNIDDLLVPQPDAAPAQAKATPTEKSAPLPVRIGAIAFTDGSANFADFSLTPNFATAIQQLNGTVGTLDNQKPLAARVDIKGRVDRYAPVTIEGSLIPFDPMSSLDITTRFQRVELTTLTPYSGKFAGYRIRKGRLDLDLHYQITKGQLKADNKVVVEQLELGDKVDSPDALNLPIKLAVALLKDTHGRISIALPVAGDLNNPQFSVMPVVWQTLRNLLLRTAQAPFKLLGNLVQGGSNEDLGTITFAAGSSDLDAQAQADLMKVATALNQKPELRLEVEGASAAQSDGPLIAVQRLEREYQAMWYKVLQRRGDKIPAQASQITVPEAEKAALLEGIYRTRLKQQPPAEWQALEAGVRQQKLQAAVIDSWRDSNALLRSLGQARAASIKDFMVNQGKLADERVYLIDARLESPGPNGRVTSLLHVDVAP
jgi:outer membrane protein OmpA-like peptidoglycan-associated protein